MSPRCLVTLGLALLAAGCLDHTGPQQPDAQLPAPQGPHLLRWAGSAAPRFAATGPIAKGGIPAFSSPGTAGLGLDAYTATFWAVRGQERTVQISYQSGTDTTYPFLRFTVSDPSYVPGVGELAVGDSVLISITVDGQDIEVALEPTGLQFGTPAELEIWYGGANGDLNGDGCVDDDDAYIEQQLLGMWYRETVLDPWTPIPAFQLLADKSFTSQLEHFSQYAVSW
jgi:hypothetical protein